jgi:hypothetical protein
MLMNGAETIAIDNPARRALQRWYEAPRLRRLGGPLRAAGLVNAHRTGRDVLYARTGVAESLLAGSTA